MFVYNHGPSLLLSVQARCLQFPRWENRNWGASCFDAVPAVWSAGMSNPVFCSQCLLQQLKFSFQWARPIVSDMPNQNLVLIGGLYQSPVEESCAQSRYLPYTRIFSHFGMQATTPFRCGAQDQNNLQLMKAVYRANTFHVLEGYFHILECKPWLHLDVEHRTKTISS